MYLKAFFSAAGGDLLISALEQGLAMRGAPYSAAETQGQCRAD